MLVLKNIAVRYKNQKETTLEDINITFYEKQFYALMGSSGVGKTTLLNTICFGTPIVNGSISYNVKTIDKKDIKKFRKNIGIISQKPMLIDDMNVYDNLRLISSQKNNLFMKIFNIVNKKQKQQIFDLLKEFGLLDKVFFKTKDLSGGEAQRIEIIKLILKDKKIILVDEPTSNLDFENAKRMVETLKKVIIKNNAIGIINLHDQSLVNENIDVVIGLKNKKVFLNETNNKNIKNKLKDLYYENKEWN